MAKDPYRYFRIEGRELIDGLAAGAPRLADVGGRAEALALVLRLAHTLKGAARVVRAAAMADEAHAVETLLADCRHNPERVTRAHIDGVLAAADRLALMLAGLDASGPSAATAAATQAIADASPAGPPVAAPPAPPSPPSDSLSSIRVEAADLDRLLDGLTDLRLRLRGLDELTRDLDALQRRCGRGAGDLPPAIENGELLRTLGSLQRRLEDGLDGWRRDLDDLRDATADLRLLPLERVFGGLGRTVRSAAEERGLEVDLQLAGGECRVDGRALVPLRDALIQLLRNAVAHGIEPAADRQAIGKPRRGQLRVDVEARGEHLHIRCSDDGRGIDFAAIRRRLVAQRVVDGRQAEQLDEDALLQRLLRGGISTATEVSGLAGRGIGLDLVRDAVQRTQGRLALASEPGRGTRWDIQVPVSLLALPVLQVRCADQRIYLPQATVRHACRVASAGRHSETHGDTLAFDGQLLPLRSLAALLGEQEGDEPAMLQVVILGDGAHRAALVVDAILGTADAVVRPLPVELGEVELVSGASIDQHGDPVPVIDVDHLLARAHAGSAQRRRRNAVIERAPILVIDDSLTTRMMEQSILEAAGYAVDLAVSADEALARDDLARFKLIVCDVEMPGRDGYAFVTALRADPVLKATPCILVTSRGSPEDRARGRDAGADAYVVKGEFDQDLFLGTIARLLGRA